ncbi:MAG TPA: Hsp20/alpha crystallin family protein [Moorella mulderi]|nr:Hsp20/alpha crystallin family protein [Moorella mulderi]
MEWPGKVFNIWDLWKQDKPWPPVDVMETAQEIIVLVVLPGLQRPEDVRVELKGNSLQIEGELPPEIHLLGVQKIHQKERKLGKFSRTLTLPANVQPKGARALYQRGILEIRMAKAPGREGEMLSVEFLKIKITQR